MRRIVLGLMGTVVAVILLFGYRTSTGGTVAAAPLTAATAPPSTPTTAPTTGAGSGSSSGSGSSGSSGSTGTKTYSGSVASTRWGDVQVQITVSGGKITAASPLEVPQNNPRDIEINNYAVPILNQEVVTAQSKDIDAVSGATVTSDGYIESLQSALDQAGL